MVPFGRPPQSSVAGRGIILDTPSGRAHQIDIGAGAVERFHSNLNKPNIILRLLEEFQVYLQKRVNIYDPLEIVNSKKAL
jgi:hypothetical protein